MELSLAEIRNFMLNNGCKVTNHALVKHFKEFLTNPDTQNEARKQFKTYVNILATIRTEDKRDGSNEKEKYLILKPKYLHECPSEDNISLASGTLMSPASRSISSEMDFSPSGRQPPPYRPPPDVSPGASGSGTPAKVAVLEPQTRVQYKDCINEYRTAIMALQRQPSLEAPVELRRSESQEDPPQVPPRKRSSAERSFSIEKSSSDDTVSESNKENVAIMEEMLEIAKTESENKISVKEATKKFNKIASEEEKIISPSSKKKPEKIIDAEINDQEALVSDPKAKEWLVSAARCNYQELSKLASDNPRLVKLRDPTTYTALHWAAKHGNENVVKLIAGTYKANANAQTNGGYTPLHISMQFGRDNIFELLQNVYKVDRDILDWSGKKALDYRRQKTAVSASTYSKIKAKKKHTERESGFLRIGSLRNFLGVGSSHHHGTQNRSLIRSSVPSNKFATSAERFDKLHKSWGSADNLPHNPANMPPPKNGGSAKKRRTRRHADYPPVLPGGGVVSSQSQSMPTTPNQPRAPIHILSEHPQGSSMGDSDSDSACGFDSNWSGVRPTYI